MNSLPLPTNVSADQDLLIPRSPSMTARRLVEPVASKVAFEARAQVNPTPKCPTDRTSPAKEDGSKGPGRIEGEIIKKRTFEQEFPIRPIRFNPSYISGFPSCISGFPFQSVSGNFTLCTLKVTQRHERENITVISGFFEKRAAYQCDV